MEDIRNKYYTPSIEEFHVGFEFERKDSDDDVPWIKHILSLDNIEFLYDDFECGYNGDPKDIYRVKRLDKEDIESLGFKQGKLPYQYFKDTYILVELGNNMYSISQPSLYDDTEFRGVIKNKSELKKLLTMLNIPYA